MITVALHGPLGDKYGEEFKFNARTPAEVIRALGYQITGFLDDILLGKFALLRDNFSIDETHLDLPFGDAKTFHIIPVPGGAGGSGGGLGKIILGTVIVGAVLAAGIASGGIGAAGLGGFLGGSIPGTSISFGMAAAAGGLLAVAGAAQLLSPTPQVGNTNARERPENRASFLLNSQVNTTEEGGPVPVLLGGPLDIGSVLIAASLGAQQVPIEEVLEEDIEFTSAHGFAPEEFSFTTDTIEFRGFTSIQVRNEDLTVERGRIGNMGPVVYRNKEIRMVGEIHDTVTDEYAFHVVILNTPPRDFFDIVTVSNVDETIEYLQLSPNSADEFTPDGELRYTFQQAPGHLTGASSFRRVRCARWTWNRGTGVGFVVPEGAGQLVRFDY